MFACLVVDTKKPKGILERILGRIRKPGLRLEEASAFGAEYPLMRATLLPGQELDWQAVKAGLPARTRCLLVPEGITPPEGLFPVTRFARFEAEVLLRTACALVVESGIPAHRRVAGLFDPDAEYRWLLPELLKRYTSVRVLTGNTQRYHDAAERVFEETGAPILIGDDPTDFSDCVLLLCPVRPCALPLPPRCPALGTEEIPGCRGFALYTPRISVPGGATPPGISANAFAGALYEYHGVAAGSLVASGLMTGGHPAEPGQIVQIMRQNAKGC